MAYRPIRSEIKTQIDIHIDTKLSKIKIQTDEHFYIPNRT
jgi:hypothetical protein